MHYRASVMVEVIVDIVDGEIVGVDPLNGYGSTYVEVVDLDTGTDRQATADEAAEALDAVSGRWEVSSLPR